MYYKLIYLYLQHMYKLIYAHSKKLKILFAALDLYACMKIRFRWLVKACEQAQARLKPRPVWLELSSLIFKN